MSATDASSSTHRRFLRSAIASGLSQGWRVTVTLGAMLVLRRFIEPADWGFFAWTLVVFMVLGAVRDLGLAYHVMRIDERPFGNLLVVEVVWGGTLAAAVALLAPTIAGWTTNPHAEFIGVLRAMTVFLFFEGLSTVPKFYFDSEMQVGRTVLPEVLRNLCFVGLSVALAVAGAGVWSLVIGQAAAAVLYAALLWSRAWPGMPLRYLPGRTFALIRASLPLALIWFLLILTRHVDPLVLELLVPYSDIGNYTFAYEWATIISVQLLLPAVGRALYPMLVALAMQTTELFRAFAMATRLVLAFEVAAAGVLFLNAETVLRLVGGGQWQDAPDYLRILCFAPLVDPLSRLGGEVLKARNLDRLWIASGLATVTTFAVGGYFATAALGPVGMAWVNLVPVGGLVMAIALYRLAPAACRRLLLDVLWIYSVALPVFWVVSWVAVDHTLLRLLAACGAAGVFLSIVTWRFGREMVAFFRQSSIAPESPSQTPSRPVTAR